MRVAHAKNKGIRLLQPHLKGWNALCGVPKRLCASCLQNVRALRLSGTRVVDLKIPKWKGWARMCVTCAEIYK